MEARYNERIKEFQDAGDDQGMYQGIYGGCEGDCVYEQGNGSHEAHFTQGSPKK